MGELLLSGITKAFGDVKILHGIDCTVGDGEFIAVVGPSGCGKTTLLRLVAGLEDVSSGEIRIDGRLVNDLMPRDRNIAMVFQNYALYPHKSVYENLAYSLRLRRASRTEIEQRVAWAANLLQITPLLRRRPGQLSGGQRQRVAMGRAIVRQPSLFLFDEPLSNLDANLRSAMRIELRKLHSDLGITSLYVTHDQTEAMTLADRVIVLRAGVIEQMDSPAAIYDRPASSFVAAFMGSPPMNLLPITITANGQSVDLGPGGSVPCPPSLAGRTGREMVLGVRPEHLRLSIGDQGLEVQAELVEMLGADSYLHGRLLGTDIPVVSRVDRRSGIRPGDRVRLLANTSDFHVFDATTGLRIETAA